MPRLNPKSALTSLIPESGPQRVYLLATLVNIFGFGLLMTAMTLYGTRALHLAPTKTALVLTIAGLVGLLANVPAGHLADRRGPREMLRLSMLVQCAASIGYAFVNSFVTFLIVAIVEVTALNASLAADGALLRRVGGDDETAAAFRSTSQVVINVGIALGVAGTGVAAQINTPDAYRALFLINALTFLVAIALLNRLPRYEPLPGAETSSPWAALKDRAFVAYTALSGAMWLQFSVVIFMVPLWVVYHTNAPRWSITLFVWTNTLLIVLFQVRIGKNVQTVRQGGTALRRAGVIFLFSCSAIGLATGIPAWAALLVLVAAVALHTYGELWHTAALFALDFGLAPAHLQGQYQGLIGVGNGISQAAAPIVLIGVFLSLGRLGFVLLGACFALLGLLAPLVTSWGERTRPPAENPQDEQVIAAD